MRAYVPGRIGLLRFALATSGERFPTVRFDLGSVMGTMMTGPKGRLQLPPLSNLFLSGIRAENDAPALLSSWNSPNPRLRSLHA